MKGRQGGGKEGGKEVRRGEGGEKEARRREGGWSGGKEEGRKVERR